jgi:hypothetical protein
MAFQRVENSLHYLIDSVTAPVQNRYFRWKNGQGTDVMSEDWDNLILLDACRFDYFEEENTFAGELSRVQSRGGHSWEFMEGNFVGRQLHDTVYVTANPHAEKLEDDVFYTIWKVLDRWDDDLETVAPEDVVSEALAAHETYPNKRLIVHFMQPHEPWIGPTMEQIEERVSLKGWDKYHGREDTSTDLQGMGPWDAVRENIVSKSEMRQAYRESLQIVLDHVQELVAEFGGKSVISADHGELLGERIAPGLPRWYGHPHDVYLEEAYFVPWLELPHESRREVVAEEPIGSESLDEDVVDQRLKALGYR